MSPGLLIAGSIILAIASGFLTPDPQRYHLRPSDRRRAQAGFVLGCAAAVMFCAGVWLALLSD